MAKHNPKSWFQLITRSYSRQIIQKLLPGMIGLGLLAVMTCYIEMKVLKNPLEISNAVHSLLGFVLSLFLVFRTNTAYDRWWEGRKQWGALVNTTRMLAIRMSAWVADEQDRLFFKRTLAGFPVALKEHLREGVSRENFSEWYEFSKEDLNTMQHIPNSIAYQLSARIADLVRAGALTPQQQLLADGDVGRMVDILGACERIKKTPIPHSYSMFMKKFIFLYVVTLPIGFVHTFKWWTIPVVMGVFYILVAVELIGDEIEEPFGTDANDLPIDEMAKTMQRNIAEVFGKRQNAM